MNSRSSRSQPSGDGDPIPAAPEAEPSAAFTPGPWRVVIYDAGDDDVLSGMPSVVASEELDCGIVHTKGFVQRHWRSARGDAEIHANARLIAAAPDHYAAARELDRLMLVIESAVRNADPSHHEAVLAALKANRAAIAKAEAQS